MAGYSKGIVDTRKLNKNSKAKLGRRGDTKIRKVDNRESHVNALEAYLIDVNGKAGEDYAKRIGAGTVNPLTGMPEYHTNTGVASHDDVPHLPMETPSQSAAGMYERFQTLTDTSGLTRGTIGQASWEDLQNMSEEQRAQYMGSEFGIGRGYEQYITGFKEEPFGFLKEQQALTTQGLESSYGATMGALGSQQEALGRTTGRGFRAATSGRDIAASRSGLATSGTVTQAYETQKKDLFQDYTAGMEDIGRERGTALDTLTLGKEGAGLDFRQAEYAEQQRQLEEFYTDLGAIGQLKNQ